MSLYNYKTQVTLLLQILPSIALKKCFAMHGGSAINLFVREIPRLSVDIDLTYLPIEDRLTTFKNIEAALLGVKEQLIKVIPGILITGPFEYNEQAKLFCNLQGVQVKVEVNTVMRGVIDKPVIRRLSTRAQEKFDQFCEMPIVSLGQLYGGKICAALDRQHPRDLFDVKYMFESEGFTPQIKQGFLFCLLSNKRPIHEILNPTRIDQRTVLLNQFSGMTEELFTYDEYDAIRTKLIQVINQNLGKKDSDFLISFKEGVPDWNIDAFTDFRGFPAIQWKLQNIQKLKQQNPQKHKIQLEALKSVLVKFRD